MGNKYSNVTVYGPTQAEVVAALDNLGHRAFVAPSMNRFTVVYDEDKWQELNRDKSYNRSLSGEEREHLKRALMAVPFDLSTELQCAVFAVTNFDDDVLSYDLIINGRSLDTYHSTGIFEAASEYEAAMEVFEDSDDPNAELPEEVDEIEARKSRGGNAQALCEAFGAPEVQERVRILLHETHFTFEVWRHMELAELLKMPNYAIGCDYQDALEGNLPEDLSLSDLQRAGPHDA